MGERHSDNAVILGRCVVAIDGPAGSGKSTVSRRLASILDGQYLDTGAMYRAVAWAVLADSIDPNDSDAVSKLVTSINLEITTDPHEPGICVDGVDVSTEIRGPEVTSAVSAVAAVPTVRRILVADQRSIIGRAERIVVEGRDIATAVAPDADLKVFLTASVDERARRRSAETSAEQATTASEIQNRDYHDSTRAVDPLRQSAQARVLDTTTMTIDEVVEETLRMLSEAVRP